jgi:hypothetical protein
LIFKFYGGPPVSFDDMALGVGSGWKTLLHGLCEKLFHLGWDGELQQVKEKYGTLRFYWRNNIDGIAGEIAEDVVQNAEAMSGQTCEVCGKYGRLRGSGWLYTSCEEHLRP